MIQSSKAWMHTALVCAISMAAVPAILAQPKGFNYDEAKVPVHKLPDPLMTEEGKRVDSVRAWERKRRGGILALFEEHVYGRTPDQNVQASYAVYSVDRKALGGKAVRKEVRATFSRKGRSASMDILIYLPRNAKGPVPLFVGLNFYGNHTLTDEPEVTLNNGWMRASKSKGIVEHRATEASRGTSASRWAIAKIVGRGYGLATIYCGDLDPDIHDGFANGIHPLFHGDGKPAADEWGTIGAWAWGLSRALDYFEKDRSIDHQRVAVIGHSRLGKTSLWAGAQDERFALAISNNSGCGGAALSRRRFGETVERINTSFPHWFCGNFKKFNGNEDALPVDQHMLIALMAPRPVYVASATEDKWADPNGEFLAARHAGPVYALYGLGGVGVAKQPAPDQPVGDRIGYHLRTGKHDVTDYDWERYLDFADRHLQK